MQTPTLLKVATVSIFAALIVGFVKYRTGNYSAGIGPTPVDTAGSGIRMSSDTVPVRDTLLVPDKVSARDRKIIREIPEPRDSVRDRIYRTYMSTSKSLHRTLDSSTVVWLDSLVKAAKEGGKKKKVIMQSSKFGRIIPFDNSIKPSRDSIKEEKQQ